MSGARLENWFFRDNDTIGGQVYGHYAFADGTFIFTSRVGTIGSDWVVRTKNSNYILGKHLSDSNGSYRDEVTRTCSPELLINPKELLSNGALGLAGEAGECVDLIKKHLHHGVPLDKTKLIKELGDVRWYLELLAISADVSMEEIERQNTEKLRIRYPIGFNTADSIARRDVT